MGIGSKMLVQTVLKLIDDAMTATKTSSLRVGNRHLVDVQAAAGVLVATGQAVEHVCSSRRTKAARVVAGIGIEDKSSPEAPASRRQGSHSSVRG